MLVNGQTGVLRGTAPKSLWRMLAAAILAAFVLGTVGLCFLSCTGGFALMGN